MIMICLFYRNELNGTSITLNLSDATNGEYFEMHELHAENAPINWRDVFRVPTTLKIEPDGTLLVRLFAQNRAFLIGLGVFALGMLGLSALVGGQASGIIIFILALTAGYFGGIPLLIRKLVNRQLSKGFAFGLTVLLVLGLFAAIVAVGETPGLSPYDCLFCFLAYRAMRIA